MSNATAPRVTATDGPCRPPRTFGAVHAPVVATDRSEDETCEAGTP